MKIKEYVEKSVHLSGAFGYKTMDEVAAIVVRPDYPEPATYTGVALSIGPRGDQNNGADWALEFLQRHIERVIGYVVNDCIGVVQQQDAMPEELRKATIQAIRDHFEIVVH